MGKQELQVARSARFMPVLQIATKKQTNKEKNKQTNKKNDMKQQTSKKKKKDMNQGRWF